MEPRTENEVRNRRRGYTFPTCSPAGRRRPRGTRDERSWFWRKRWASTIRTWREPSTPSVCLLANWDGRRRPRGACDERSRFKRKRSTLGHPNLAKTQYNLGSSSGKLGRTEEPKECYQLVLVFQEESPGTDHLDVARTPHEHGLCASKLMEKCEAKIVFRRALVMRREGAAGC